MIGRKNKLDIKKANLDDITVDNYLEENVKVSDIAFDGVVNANTWAWVPPRSLQSRDDDDVIPVKPG